MFPEQVWTLDEHRAQLRRFHRDGWVLGAPRALAMAPCTEWLVAPGPAPAVRASSCTAAATPRPRLAQLRAALGTEVERRADLVEEVKLLAEECSIVEAERNKIDAQLGLACRPLSPRERLPRSFREYVASRDQVVSDRLLRSWNNNAISNTWGPGLCLSTT